MGTSQFVRRVTLPLIGVVAAGLFGAMGMSSGNPVPQDIDASRIVLRDSKGTVRIILGLQDDQPYIGLQDSAGRPSLEISALKDGTTGLCIYNKRKEVRVELSALPDGASQLVLNDLGGAIGTTTAACAKGTSGVVVHHAKKGMLAGLAALPDGTRQLRLADKKGKPRALVDVDPQGTPSVRLSNAAGKTRVYHGPGDEDE